VNDSMARRAIKGANRCTYDLIIDVGILSITDDLAGMLQINLLTSSADGGCKSVSMFVGMAYEDITRHDILS